MILAPEAAILCASGRCAAQTWAVSSTLEYATGPRLAYDAARECTVLFDGDTRRTWESVGGEWSLRTPATAPSLRVGFALAYDAARARVVLFGGLASPIGRLSDTWEWDGEDWTRRNPITTPPARSAHALAYDGIRQRIVLFGGEVATTTLADTWEWDGSNWSPRSVPVSPPARGGHGLAYDLARQRVVLFGGSGAAGLLRDTWLWDGTMWSQATTTISPSARHEHAMAYDLVRQRTVVFGGNATSGSIGETWEWDGSVWTQRSSATRPEARASVATYDLARRRVVLAGGLAVDFGTGTRRTFSDTWNWDGSDWVRRLDGGPSPRGNHAVAYDRARQRVVLFGGSASTSNDLSDTWEWDGLRWLRRTPTVGPTARSSHGMAYDAARQRVVLFGGMRFFGSVQEFGDTWEWDGSTWSRLTPLTSPSPRFGVSMAYDAVRRRVVLFGGESGGASLAETWEWDGTQWLRMSPVTRPNARANAGAAWDPARQRVVLCGGSDRGSSFNETWEWDGTNWTAHPSLGGVPRRAVVAYDEARQRLVFFGDLGLNPADTWERVGTQWARLLQNVRPSRTSDHAMTYDAARRRIVMPGDGQTWLYQAQAGVSESFGQGCHAGSTPPVLSAPVPVAGSSDFWLAVTRAPANAPCVLGWALNMQSAAIGHCTFYLNDPMVLLPAVTNATGFVRLSLPVPQAAGGIVSFAQGFVADAQGPFQGIAFTAGRRLVVE